jgi:hypothetical protein
MMSLTNKHGYFLLVKNFYCTMTSFMGDYNNNNTFAASNIQLAKGIMAEMISYASVG